MIDSIYAVCRKYQTEEYGEVHTIDSCFFEKKNALSYLEECYFKESGYIDEITDRLSVQELSNECLD